jgi:iron complex transport system ATP-binding protein
MGRHAHLAPLQGLGEADRTAVRQALTRTDTMHLKDRLITELSGGELQRVVIARALAQEPRALLLDEPTNHLDINHQLDIARMLRELNRERGLTVIWVSHDLNLAAEFCERIVVIHEGAVAADGTPAEVIRAEMLEAVYGVRVPVVANPLSGRPQVVLVGEEGAP